MGIALPALALVAVTMSTRGRILPSLRRLRGLPPSTDLADVVRNLLHLIELQIEVPEGALSFPRRQSHHAVPGAALDLRSGWQRPAHPGYPGVYCNMALKTARFLALLFTGRALGPAPAWSVESRSFAKLDTNDDGYVRKEEAKEGSRLSEQCERYDRNLDGRIDRAEFTAFEEDGIMGAKEPGKAKSRGSGMQHAGIESGSRSY